MTADISAEALRDIRAQLPGLARGVLGNAGSIGPVPVPVAEALAGAWSAEVERGRVSAENWAAAHAAQDAVRARLAELLATTPDRLALTHHSTEGLNIAALGLPWRRGDVVVSTDLEHASVHAVLGALRLRHQIELRLVRLSAASGAEAARGLLEAAMGPRVRAVFLSHVSYATGAVLPLATVAEMAHIVGAAVVVDGAQAVGALPVSPAEVGADFYTVSGQKWLCGPEGTGALWVAPHWEERLQPGVVGPLGLATIDPEGYWQPAAGARRLEVGTTFAPGWVGWGAALDWLAGIGWTGIWRRTHDLAADARAQLGALPGVEVLTPPAHAGLVSIRMPGVAAPRAAQALQAAGFHVRSIPGWDAVRLACGFWLEREEVAAFVRAVAELRPA